MPELDERQLKRFSYQMGRGLVVLFTGAGFSMSANAMDGQKVPSVNELRQTIWPIAFGNDPIDDQSLLSEVFAVAQKRNAALLGETLENCLRIDHETLPEVYKLWFELPWVRHYTLNLDDLDEAAQRAFQFPRRLTSVNGLSDRLPPSPDLLSIHLNGRLADYPSVTFSETQYGERTATGDPWYQFLVGDLISRPIVFVGTSLDEPPLWHYLALRDKKGTSAELRPRSILVTPTLSRARREMLAGLNIDWVQMTQEQFAESYLKDFGLVREQGLTALRQDTEDEGALLLDVSSLRLAPVSEPAEFLLGREPTWGDFTSGYAVERDFERDLPQSIAAENPRIVVFTGTAGSGKSSTLFRLALKYEAAGKSVALVNRQSFGGLRRIKERVATQAPDVLVVDDADVYSAATGEFLADLATSHSEVLVLAAIRSTKYESLEVEAALRLSESMQITIPHLEDSDIDELLDALDGANRLGVLAGMTRSQQVHAFREKAGRQLLVAMYEATTGWRFEEKIAQECAELGPKLAEVYAIVAAATNLRQFLTRDELLSAIGDLSNEGANLVRRLVNQHLLIEEGSQIRVRHRVIADHVVNHFIEQGLMKQPTLGLLFAMASRVSPSSPKRSRHWAILVPLLSHDLLFRWLAGDIAVIRQAYESVEDLLNWHPHYWLQRGRFEAEHGATDLAHNFLGQAYSRSPDDTFIAAAWAGIEIRLSAENPTRSDSYERVEAAFDLLDDTIERDGARNAYPFHILGSQGLSWARSANLSRDDRKALLGRLLQAVKAGLALHQDKGDLQQLGEDIEREYLMLAVTDSETASHPEDRGEHQG